MNLNLHTAILLCVKHGKWPEKVWHTTGCLSKFGIHIEVMRLFFLIFNQYKYSSCRIWRRFLLHLESKCASLIWLSCFLKLSWMMVISFPWAFYETQELHYGVIKLSSLMPCEALKANYRTKNHLWKLFPLHIVWKLLKMSHLNFGIFPPIFVLSGNTVWPQASGFQKLAKMFHFWHF